MTRSEGLLAILRMDQPLSKLTEIAENWGWASDEELVTLERKHLVDVLNRYLASDISSEDVMQWAKLLEMREDVGFENGYEQLLVDTIFDLSNIPFHRPPLTPSKARSLVELLQK
jgi:hypothetical protein